MIDDTKTFDLAPIMKLEDCEAFDAFLRSAHGNPVTVVCGEVKRLGGLAAQQLLVAQRAWHPDAQPFALQDVGEGMIESLATLGLQGIVELPT